MKTVRYSAILLCFVILGGCANSGKYIDTRGVLDESIYYIERDKSNATYDISSNMFTPDDIHATQVPQPALVDRNSTIQIRIAKNRFRTGLSTGQSAKQSEDLLKKKEAVAESLHLLEKVVQARRLAIETYKKKDITQFYEAKKAAATIERALIGDLKKIWPEGSEGYSRLEETYDPPLFGKLQEFLNSEILSIEAANRAIEDDLKMRKVTLTLEAFLNSPGKESVALHLEDYDSIKVQSLASRDRFGLDLSTEERERLNAQVKATQELAAALERLRSGETSLNEAAQQMMSDVLPQTAKLMNEAESLYKRLNPIMLKTREKETEQLLNAYLDAISRNNQDFFKKKKLDLEQERDKLLTSLPSEAKPFIDAIQEWVTTAKTVNDNWKMATPETMNKLIDQTIKISKSFEAMRDKLPQVVENAQNKATEIIDIYVKDLNETEKDALLMSDEAVALRSNIEGYYRDFKESSALISTATASLGRLALKQVAEIPSSTSPALQVPLDEIKDTFIDLESTPRLTGDLITVKATLMENEKKVVDTSVAKFQVERYGHYAELSPAVVLIKPDQLKGGEDGFRFAPTLSWMHHWSPRPSDESGSASLFRALDPSIGIHSAFTNFRSDTSKETVQIGLGVTLSFWENRLQFGVGDNLMATSNDEGQIYYFIGSDLIGLLQTIGLAKQ